MCALLFARFNEPELVGNPGESSCSDPVRFMDVPNDMLDGRIGMCNFQREGNSESISL